MINLLIVDDHDLVRIGLKRLLNDVKGFKIAGEAVSGEEAVLLAKSLKPDVVLMDVSMSGIGGIEATRKILRSSPSIKILVITSHTEEPFPSNMLKAGALGYITKHANLEEMVQAIRTVYAGQRYLSSAIANKVSLKRVSDKGTAIFNELSEREMQIMLLVTQGMRIQDVADKLCLSPKTVNSYRYRLYEKLGVASDVELTHLAIRHGVIDIGDREIQ